MSNRRLVLAALLLAAVFPVEGDEGVTQGVPPIPDAIKGLSVRQDERSKVTAYEPAYDTWTPYGVRIYPVLRRGADGTRALLLHLSVQSERRLGIQSFDLDIDGSSQSVVLKRSDVTADTGGCAVTETVLLEGQDDLIRRLAAAREAQVNVAGIKSSKGYRLQGEELGNFARIVGLFQAESLPEPTQVAEALEAGQSKNLTNPKIIPGSRVNPEFPAMARNKKTRGRVMLHAVVRKDGSAEVVEVLNSSARYCGFEQAAIDALRKWRYEPGRQDGQPVDVYFTINFDFTYR